PRRTGFRPAGMTAVCRRRAPLPLSIRGRACRRRNPGMLPPGAGAAECRHVEPCLLGRTGILLADRAGVARPAAVPGAVIAVRCLQMTGAGGGVVARFGERIHRTRRKAWPRRTAL